MKTEELQELNRELKELFKKKGIPDEAWLVIFSLWYNLNIDLDQYFWTILPQLQLLGIVEKKNGKWQLKNEIKLYSEEEKQIVDREFAKQFCYLIDKYSNKHNYSIKETQRRLNHFFNKFNVTQQEVLEATEWWLKRYIYEGNNPQYIRAPQYFVYKNKAGVNDYFLMDVIEQYREYIQQQLINIKVE